MVNPDTRMSNSFLIIEHAIAKYTTTPKEGSTTHKVNNNWQSFTAQKVDTFFFLFNWWLRVNPPKCLLTEQIIDPHKWQVGVPLERTLIN